MISLLPEELKEVQHILARHIPDRDVYAFGSRVDGQGWQHSDLDLVIMGDEPVDLLTRALLREAFEESWLPFRVDLGEWATTGESFRRIIEQKRALIQQSRSRPRLQNVRATQGEGPDPSYGRQDQHGEERDQSDAT